MRVVAVVIAQLQILFGEALVGFGQREGVANTLHDEGALYDKGASARSCSGLGTRFHTCEGEGGEDLSEVSKGGVPSKAFQQNLMRTYNSYFSKSCYLPAPYAHCRSYFDRLSDRENARRVIRAMSCSDSPELEETVSTIFSTGAGPSKLIRYLSEVIAHVGKWSHAAAAEFPYATRVQGCNGTFACYFDDVCGSEDSKPPKSHDPMDAAWRVAAAFEFHLAHLSARSKKRVEDWIKNPQCTLHNASSNVIGLHIRRGDACELFDSSSYTLNFTGCTGKCEQKRKCYPLSEYIAAVKQLIVLYRIEAPTIKILTDSYSVIEELEQYPELNFCWLQYDRGEIGGKEGVNLGTKEIYERVYIEDRLRNNMTDNDLIMHAVMADLLYAADAGYVVSTMRSFVSNGLFLMSAMHHARLPPTISLEGSVAHTFLHSRVEVTDDGDVRMKEVFPLRLEESDSSPADEEEMDDAEAQAEITRQVRMKKKKLAEYQAWYHTQAKDRS